VREEDHVVRPLPDELRVLDSSRLITENADRLIANLPPVAVRAMQEIATPSFADTSDRRQVISDTGCDQNPAGCQNAATGQADEEARLDGGDPIIDDLYVIPGQLGPSCRQQRRRRHPVAR
jgi:hypothetical protein